MMRSIAVILLIVLCISPSFAQDGGGEFVEVIDHTRISQSRQNYSYSKSDSLRVDSLLQIAVKQKLFAKPIGERIVKIGQMLIGTPYEEKTLEIHETEKVICYLGGLDCVTFFENSWAMARVIYKYKHPTFDDFIRELQLIRYRSGKLDGYASRLHYTSDYFFDNAERGHLIEVTKTIGGKYAVLESKPINFMSTHSNLYKQIAGNDNEYKRIEFYEREIASRGGFYFIPKADVEKIEKKINDGDLIGITTSIKGIDCSHTGIAVRKNGRLHLMHASLTMKKVIISDEPLADYLAKNSKQTGIVVYRPLEAVRSSKDGTTTIFSRE